MVDATQLIRAIRDERALRRHGHCVRGADPRYIWCPTKRGPYAAFDKFSQEAAVDVLGLMVDLKYTATFPGVEIELLCEAEQQLQNMAAGRGLPACESVLHSMVSLVHGIIVEYANKGKLKRVFP